MLLAVLASEPLSIPLRADPPKPPGWARFTQRWVAPAATEAATPSGPVRGRALLRYAIPSDSSRPFLIGGITALELPAPADGDIPAAAEKFRAAMGIASWAATRRRGPAFVYEGFWRPGARFMRLYLVRRADRLSISVAVLRTAYLESTILEAEVLQRQLAGVEDRPQPWLKRLLEVPSAHAQSAPGCGSPCPPAGTEAGDACLVASSSCAINDIGPQIDDLNRNLDQGTTHLSGDASQANGNWAASNSNWSETNRQVNAIRNQFSVKNMVLAGGAVATIGTAAGIAVTATLGLVAQGIKFGFDALKEAITHKAEKERLLATFTEARKAWETSKSEVAKLELAIDRLLYLRDLSTQFGKTREELVTESRPLLEIKKRQLVRAERLLDEAIDSGNEACVTQRAKELAELRAMTAFFEDMKNLVGRNTLQEEACAELQRNLGALKLAEEDIQINETFIAEAEGVFMGTLMERYDEAWESAERARSTSGVASPERLRDDIKEHAAGNVKRTHERLEEIRERELAACADRIENGTFCAQMRRDQDRKARAFKDVAAYRKRHARDADDKINISLYLDRMAGYEKTLSSWQKACERDAGRISKAEGKNRCVVYVNSMSVVQGLERKMARAREAETKLLVAAEGEYASAKAVADLGDPDDGIHADAMIEWLGWFNELRQERACFHDESACPPGPHAEQKNLYRRLAKQAKRVENLCRGDAF